MTTDFKSINNPKLQYAPLHFSLLDDPIIKNLVMVFGLKGLAFFVRLTVKIYQNGYFLKWGHIPLKTFCYENGGNFKEKEVSQMLNLLIEGEIFNKSIFDEFEVLTSSLIQDNYFHAVLRSNKVKVYKCLIVTDYIPKSVTVITCSDISYVTNKGNNETFIDNNVTNIPVSDDEFVTDEGIIVTEQPPKCNNSPLNIIELNRIELNRKELNGKEGVQGEPKQDISQDPISQILNDQNLSLENKLFQLNELKKNESIAAELYNRIIDAETELNPQKKEKEKTSAQKEKPKDLAQQAYRLCLEAYLNFFKSYKIYPHSWTTADGKNLNVILGKLIELMKQHNGSELSAERIRDAFAALLERIRSAKDQWIFNNLTVSLINSKFSVIINQTNDNRNSTTSGNYKTNSEEHYRDMLSRLNGDETNA